MIDCNPRTLVCISSVISWGITIETKGTSLARQTTQAEEFGFQDPYQIPPLSTRPRSGLQWYPLPDMITHEYALVPPGR